MSVKAIIDLVVNDARFKPAMSAAKKMLKGVRDNMNDVARSARNMLMIGGGAAAVFLKNAAEQEAAEESLRSALIASGQAADDWFDKLNNVASALQGVTTSGDDANLAIMTMLTNMGVTADKLEGGTKAAIGLATALKMDAQSAAVMYTKALNGNFMALQKLLPAIAKAETDTEKMVLVNRLAAAGFDQAKSHTNTLSGSLTQLKNILGDAAEEFGFALMPVIKDFIERIKTLAPIVGAWAKENRELIVSIAKWSAILLGSLVILPKVIAGVNAVIIALKGMVAMYRGLLALGAGNALKALFMNPLAASIAAAAVAVGYLIARIVEMRKQTAEVKASVESVSEAWKRMADAQRASANATTFEEQLQAAKELRQALLDQAKAQDETSGNFDNEFVFSGSQREMLTDQNARAAAKLRSQAIQQQHVIDELTRKIEERNAALLNGTPPATEEELKLADAIDELKQQLNEEANTFGQTSRAVAIYRLQTQGATNDQLEELRALDQKLLAMEKEQLANEKRAEAAETAADAIKKLNDEIAITTGATTEDQIELFDLRNLGVAEDTVAEIARLMSVRTAVDRRKEVEAEVTALKEAAKTDKERLADQLKRLNELSLEGFINPEETAKLVANAVSGIEGVAVESLAGRFEGLQDTFRRIQQTAASSKGDQGSLKSIDSKLGEQLKAVNEMFKLGPMKEIAQRLLDVVSQNLPRVGGFAR